MSSFLRGLLALVFMAPITLHAAAATDTPRREIAALLQALGASQCAFFRNGTWYDSNEAESHLKRKLDYFERKQLLSSADAFINDAASRSSMSGKVYQVRCPDQPAQPSAQWLKQKLEELRRNGSDSPH